MSEKIEALEKRLQKLKPLEQEALAARILEDWQTVKCENSIPSPPVCAPIVGDVPAASPRSCCFASLSLCSAFVGAMVGAAATFLAMTFFVPPKVEIREVVREVRVKADPETKLATDRPSSPVESGSENPTFEPPKSKKKFDERLALADASFHDLDALLAERKALARQMARYESSVGSASSRVVPPRLSPEEYRELLRELKL